MILLHEICINSIRIVFTVIAFTGQYYHYYLRIRAQFGINIIAIKRGKEIVVSPDPSMNIEFGDILIMIGHDNDLNRFEKL